jgi:hypothetical protein
MANQQQVIDDQAKRIEELEKALGFYADFDDEEVVATLYRDGWSSDQKRVNHLARKVLGREVQCDCNPLSDEPKVDDDMGLCDCCVEERR